jgi:hypothetical protein
LVGLFVLPRGRESATHYGEQYSLIISLLLFL